MVRAAPRAHHLSRLRTKCHSKQQFLIIHSATAALASSPARGRVHQPSGTDESPAMKTSPMASAGRNGEYAVALRPLLP